MMALRPADDPELIAVILEVMNDGVERTKIDIIKEAKWRWHDEAGNTMYGLKELKECVDYLQIMKIIVDSRMEHEPRTGDAKFYHKSTIST